MRTRVKICGVSSLEIARQLVDEGVDAIGFIFHPQSPRNVNPELVKEICTDLPVWVNRTGVFVHQNPPEILNIVAETGLDTIQLHGDQDEVFIQELRSRTNLPIILARRVEGLNQEVIATLNISGVNSYLLDKWDADAFGGTGQVLELQDKLSAEQIKFVSEKVILAGGINTNNLRDILQKVKPFGIDLSSSLEQEKGIKSPQLIREFMAVFRQWNDKSK